MKVTGLTIDPFTNMPIIILKDLDERARCPLDRIDRSLRHRHRTGKDQARASDDARPDRRTILSNLDVHVTKVEVNDLADNTFYARIY
jgi:bifunctional DNase/RNase